MMYLVTSEELENLAITSRQIHEVAEAINSYVASDDYRNGVKSAVSAINRVSQQLNQQFVKRAKNE